MIEKKIEIIIPNYSTRNIKIIYHTEKFPRGLMKYLQIKILI